MSGQTVTIDLPGGGQVQVNVIGPDAPSPDCDTRELVIEWIRNIDVDTLRATVDARLTSMADDPITNTLDAICDLLDFALITQDQPQ